MKNNGLEGPLITQKEPPTFGQVPMKQWVGGWVGGWLFYGNLHLVQSKIGRWVVGLILLLQISCCSQRSCTFPMRFCGQVSYWCQRSMCFYGQVSCCSQRSYTFPIRQVSCCHQRSCTFPMCYNGQVTSKLLYTHKTLLYLNLGFWEPHPGMLMVL